MKRAEAITGPDPKRRKVSYDTFTKWQRDLDKNFQTVTWLECQCENDFGKKIVSKISCSLCKKYHNYIRGRKNFSEKWITGAESLRTSNIRDHAQSEQHKHALSLLKKEQARIEGVSCTSYAPIAKSLHKLSSVEHERLRRKFDISYFVTIEKLSFRKYSRICDLESRHGVDLGTSYRNDVACKTFTGYIAEARRQEIIQTLRDAPFFSLMLDGSTDKGCIDNELVLVAWCDWKASDEKVHTRVSYLKVIQPKSVSGRGLFEVLEEALRSVGISSIDATTCHKLVGIGTDGASSNIAKGGLKGLLEAQLSWIFWMWCLAHRIELAIKDALKGTSFGLIDEMLMRLYYLYEKSPKKLRELEEIVNDLKQCLEFGEGGNKPIRASGSRWISHKVNALKRILSKYGAYTNHLAALSEDPAVKSVDRAKLKGYYLKWTEGKYLLGCAVFVDLLTPCSIFSKEMQSDDVDILSALNSLLRTVKEIDKLSSTTAHQWLTYSATVKKISTTEEGKQTYQLQDLKNFDAAKSYYANHFEEYCSKIAECVRSRMTWSDTQIIRDIIFLLGTQGWEKVVEESLSMDAISRLVARFEIPLQGASVNTDEIVGEFEAMLQYAMQYISVSTIDYRGVWWRLFNAPNASEWRNVLCLATLLFSLPASNAKLERVFSQLNVIKTDKRTLLSNDTLDDLMLLTSQNVPLDQFCADSAIDLWWRSKLRRPEQRARKIYRKRSVSESMSNPGTSSSYSSTELTGQETNADPSESDDNDILDDWDTFMQYSADDSHSDSD